MREQKRPMRLNIGSASIIMLFSVLCLTVLAALSLLSANSQWSITKRSADSVADYYKADLTATEIFNRVKSGDTSEVSVDSFEGTTYIAYSVPVNDRQALDVRLAESDGIWKILSWSTVDSADWIPDDSLNIWDGGGFEIVDY